MNEVSVRGLTKTFSALSKPALDNVSFDVKSGTLTALVGPSGCGKTTALKIIAGLIAPTFGDVSIGGKSVIAQAPERREVVMVFQNPLLFPHMSVAENIGFGLFMQGRPKAEVAARVASMLNLIQLPTSGERRPSQLSGGQAQRVALARALILKPRVLLLDEPLSNLDQALRAEMRELIQDLLRATGITTIFVTHDQTEAVEVADHIALLLNGRLQQYGPPESFFNEPVSKTVAEFFGAKNFIAGHSNGTVFTSELGPLNLGRAGLTGAGVVTIRPENIHFGAASNNTIQATLIEKVFLGTQSCLKLETGEQKLQMLISPDVAASLTVGQSVTINLPPSALWLLP